MITEQDAFLADIIANPDDDTPRLIYADWLEDFGTEEIDSIHARLIRLMIERTKTDPDFEIDFDVHPRTFLDDPDPVVVQAWRLAHELRRFLAGEGTGIPLKEVSRRFDFTAGIWWRGFLTVSSVPMLMWLQVGKDLVAKWPITYVRVYDKEPNAAYDESFLGYCWDRFGRSTESHTIPECLRKYTDTTKLYTIPDDAMDALSDACLRWAKHSSP